MKRQADLVRIAAIVGKLEESYADRIGVNLSGEEMIPRRDEIISVTEKLLEIIFPGYQRKFETAGPAALLLEVQSELANQICRAMRRKHKNSQCDCQKCVQDSCGHAVYTLLEKLCDDLRIRYIRDAKYITAGLAPIAAFHIAKESEIKNLRMVLTGKAAGLSDEIMKERLRETYV